MKLNEIQIRDPFILPVGEHGKYYLFGSTDADIWKGPGTGFDCYQSDDLITWEGPLRAFRPDADFWADSNFWAPEVHAYQGRWFMFATFKSADRTRGTQVLVSEHPEGPYLPHSDGPLTPSEWECLDGTLHVDDEGQPWMIFCHEWVQIGDGTICAIKLTTDLRRADGEPLVLFNASDAPWVHSVHSKRHGTGFVTDGPYVHVTREGALNLLWASFRNGRYSQGLAFSPTGAVEGPWQQADAPLYDADGGHGMIFSTFDGELKLALHTPNETPHERAVFIPLSESEGRLYVAEAGLDEDGASDGHPSAQPDEESA